MTGTVPKDKKQTRIRSSLSLSPAQGIRILQYPDCIVFLVLSRLWNHRNGSVSQDKKETCIPSSLSSPVQSPLGRESPLHPPNHFFLMQMTVIISAQFVRLWDHQKGFFTRGKSAYLHTQQPIQPPSTAGGPGVRTGEAERGVAGGRALGLAGGLGCGCGGGQGLPLLEEARDGGVGRAKIAVHRNVGSQPCRELLLIVGLLRQGARGSI